MEKRVFDITYRAQVESGEFGLQTREGCPARIICWNRENDSCPLVVLVKRDGWEEVWVYRNDGTVAHGSDEYDLFVIVPDGFDGIEAAYLRFRDTHVATVSKFACFEGGVRYAQNLARINRVQQDVRWHRAPEGEFTAGVSAILLPDGRTEVKLAGVDFEEGEYYIAISELKKLPKEG